MNETNKANTRPSDQERIQAAMVEARNGVVQIREQAIDSVREMVQGVGVHIDPCAAEDFPTRASVVIPELMRTSLEPLLRQIEALSRLIGEYDERIKQG